MLRLWCLLSHVSKPLFFTAAVLLKREAMLASAVAVAAVLLSVSSLIAQGAAILTAVCRVFLVLPYLSTVASMSYSVTTSRFYGRLSRGKERLAKS